MKNSNIKKYCFALCFFICFSVLIMMPGCGMNKDQEEVTIHYHADDGEFVAETDLVVPKEDAESAKQKEKQIIILATSAPIGWDSLYQQLVNLFNNESEEYYVELTNYGFGDELQDARLRINAEIGTGGGPDVLMEDLFPIDQEKLDKGTLVDLTPYLRESGITHDKYFPAYASLTEGDRIYGISPSGGVVCFAVDKKVLGNEEPPELEVLLDRLLAYPEKAAFLNVNESATHIMEWFLGGSEDLWGAVDWESRTCDFTTPIFSKILEVAKRYSEDGEKGFEPVMSVFFPDPNSWGQILEEINHSGNVMIGYYFDDGRHSRYTSGYTLVINANTKNLDGAYAFLSFVMTMKGQSYSLEPVHKGVWEEKVQYYMDLIEEGKTQLTLNEEMKKQLIDLYDDGRYLPRKSEVILDIVLEETESYFAGTKKKEEVLEVIQNRTQLFLDE